LIPLQNILGSIGQARVDRQAARWLAHLHADRCDDSQRARFRAWLSADARHAKAFEELTAVWELVGARTDYRPAAISLSRRSVLVGASAALTAAAGGFVALSAGAENYRTEVGERRSITLADRSRVLLDADSHLRVRNRDTGCEATLERGRAHFDLGLRSSGSLIVRAKGCALRVDRGSFEIEAVEGRAARFLMLSGAASVDVEEFGGRQGHTLTSGHMFDAAATTVTPMAAATVERLTAWQDGRAIFSNDSLADAVVTMNRYDRQRLTLGDEHTASLRISGTFRVGDNAAFAEALKAMLPIDVATTGASVQLTRRAARRSS
jgi:transmembrane sensor